MTPAGTTVEINKAHFPVTVLGPGRRIGLWLQGCSIGCKGCVSMDTWPRDPGKTITVRDLIGWCRQVASTGLDGVTISGGEPFDQPAALLRLLLGLQEWRVQSGMNFDVICFSGYPLKRLRRRHPKILALLDAIIPEPFIDGQPTQKPWRGSDNQPLVPLSERGRTLYTHDSLVSCTVGSKSMQVAVEGGKVWMIGIPERGDMAQLESLCQSRGLNLEQVSWRR